MAGFNCLASENSRGTKIIRLEGLKDRFADYCEDLQPDGEDGLKVRRPTTSSFPSGHSSAAAFAAMMLATWDGKRLGSVWYTVASIVGVSRAYVRIHHGSDVVGGFVVGTLLGVVGRRIARQLLPA